MRSSRRIGAAAVLAALALGTAACASPPGKSGGSSGVALRLAVVGREGTPTAEIAARFARRVDELSNGSMRVTVAYWPATPGPPSTVGSLRSNAVQLGLVPSEAFRAGGATTLQALQAPLLFISYRQSARATTGPLAARLQGGLPSIGLTGLGLVPEGLYRPFGYLKPLLVPEDFAEVSIRTNASRAAVELLRMLGARPVAPDTPDIDTAVYSGFANGSDSATTANDIFPQNSYTAGNVVLFPKIDVIVASSKALDHLTPAQQALLLRAAAAARSETIAATDEPAAAAAYCRAGGTVVNAPTSALQRLRARTAPLLASLRREPGTRTLIAELERLAAGRGAAVRPCSPKTVTTTRRLRIDVYTPRSPSLVPPIGSFRRVFTVAQLRAAGAGPEDARINAGVTMLSFEGGCCIPRFALTWQGRNARPPCRGLAELVRGLVDLWWNPETPCTGYVAFGWRLDGRDLVVVRLDARTTPAWIKTAYLGIWKRVDCTPNTEFLSARHPRYSHRSDRERPCLREPG